MRWPGDKPEAVEDPIEGVNLIRHARESVEVALDLISLKFTPNKGNINPRRPSFDSELLDQARARAAGTGRKPNPELSAQFRFGYRSH
jgi:hypothetical protein